MDLETLIQNKIGAVFIPVSDMKRSIEWYCRLLALPMQESSHEGKIYTLPMQDDTAIILDSHKAVTNSSQPLCFLWTDDIQATVRFLESLAVEITSDVEDIGSVTFVQFKDPDGNLLMVCQRNV